MKSEPTRPCTIDEYIAAFPEDVQLILERIRAIIHGAAPEASEAIKYQMPTFVLHGNLVHFAAYQKHIGFYPVPSGIEQFEEELSRYKGGKGSVQFPLDQAIPYDLIEKIVAFRAAENLAKAKGKEAKPQSKKSSGQGTAVSATGSLPKLAKPAHRALASAGISQLQQLAHFTENEIEQLHGIGSNSLKQLRQALQANGLSFAQPKA